MLERGMGMGAGKELAVFLDCVRYAFY